MYQVVTDEIRKSLLILLRPLVQINFIMGTCPCMISPEGQIKTPFKYFNFGRFFLIVGLFLFFSISGLLRACVNFFPKDFQGISPNPSIPIKGHGQHGEALATFVDIACGFYVNLIPAVFLCLASCKRKEILRFFDTMSAYVHAITEYGDYQHVKRVIRRLYFMHGFIALVLATLMVVRFVSNPMNGPGNMAIRYFGSGGIDPKLIIWATIPFHVFMCCAKAGVTAFIEVSCVSLAGCMCKVVENVSKYLDEVMKSWQTRFLDLPLTTSVLHRGPNSEEEKVVNTNNKDMGKSRKIQMDFQNYLERVSTYNRNGSGYPQAIGGLNMARNQIREEFCGYPELTPGQQIMHVINKFQAVRNMQTAANGLFGFVLALNTGLMVFLTVVLKYMLIWNFGNLLRQYKGESDTGNETLMATENSTGINPHDQLFLHTSSVSEWSMFALYDTCFAVRLFVLVIFLGNVHNASQNFNAKLAQALLQAQNIGDIVERQGMGNRYFQGRPVMTVNEANTALAFITGNSANPMAFSAAGLFCFSRSLILVIFSIIITYLVFLLQV